MTGLLTAEVGPWYYWMKTIGMCFLGEYINNWEEKNEVLYTENTRQISVSTPILPVRKKSILEHLLNNFFLQNCVESYEL